MQKEHSRSDEVSGWAAHMNGATYNLTVFGLHLVDSRARESGHKDDMGQTVSMNRNKDLSRCQPPCIFRLTAKVTNSSPCESSPLLRHRYILKYLHSVLCFPSLCNRLQLFDHVQMTLVSKTTTGLLSRKIGDDGTRGRGFRVFALVFR